MSDGGTAGVTEVTMTHAANTADRMGVAIQSAPNEPGLTNWASGTWTVRLNVTTANTNITLQEVYISRVNSGGVHQETLGSTLAIGTALSAGVKSVNVTGSAATSPAATDEIYIEMVFDFGGSHGNESVGITFDQNVDSPLVGAIVGDLAATDAGGDTASFAGDVDVQGDLAATDSGGTDIASFTGGVDVQGDLTGTDTNDTAAFTGTTLNPIEGDLAATDVGNTDSATFSAFLIVSGDLAATDAMADTASMAGVVPVQGDIAITETIPDTSNMAGQIYVDGDLAATDPADVAAFTGAVQSNTVAGDLAATDTPDTASGAGDILIQGDVGGTDIKDLMAFIGTTYPLDYVTSPAMSLLIRYLDTDGDGGGTDNANGNYASAADDFYIENALGAEGGQTYEIHRMIVSAQDTASMQAQEYGNLGAALTNGIRIYVDQGGGDGETAIDGGLAIKSNAEWGRLCYDVEVKSWGSGNEMLLVRWTFSKAGDPLILRQKNSKLIVRLNDDFSGLIDHHFMVQGVIT
jgi:hypothetical protein